MPTRRVVLKAMSTAAILTATKTSAETIDLNAMVMLRAKQLGEAMSELHGGVWRVSIDKNFALISKSLVSPPSRERR